MIVFWTFFLFGPMLAALLQLLLHFIPLLISGGDLFDPRMWRVLLIFSALEAGFICLFALPASFVVAVCAQSIFAVFGRVSFAVVIAAIVLAIGLENVWPPFLYIDYFETHSLGGPFYSSQGTGSPATFVAAVFLELFMHLVPASMCWWIVRNDRLVLSS